VDKISGEFKDPMAAMLEGFSRFGPDEQAWYQIVITPTDQKDTRKRGELLINKLKGIKVESKKTFGGHAAELGGAVTKELLSTITGTPPPPPPKKEVRPEFPKLFALSPGEREVLEAVERKAGKIAFQTKIRFIYVAKKSAMSKSRAAQPFVGSIKQTNTFHMQALKPEMKHVAGSSSIWWFKTRRNNHRKHKIMQEYRWRTNWGGLRNFSLSTEELATLWHFPILIQVKAPSLGRTEAKKTEAPANVPFA